ncbi:hypothetical protein MKW94_029224 [Papaver nudicaule]|uniref:RING-type E3 ubiquitin transferase n=1 Tax=Papaver nudicaule TaxID=74823 RepID=A0AA41VSW5_PAPNU|nr:hypothetical protein [Papaver nudicaule]
MVSRGGDVVCDNERRNYDVYFDNGSGLQTTIQDSFIGSGYNQLLTQFPHTESSSQCSQCNQQRASNAKAVVESMPVVEVSDGHVSSESECAICNQFFELGTEAREMPCKHIYHADCILPWLSKINSGPVCRHELPTDMNGPPMIHVYLVI